MRSILVKLTAILALLTLAACGGGGGVPLPADQVQAVAYKAEGPPELTIVTMINNRTGRGGHTALMVSGSQRVLFDPAGSYRPDYITEHGDVLYGVTDQQFQYYRSAHARNTFHVVSQTIPVAPEVAEQALALVQARGRVPGAFCTNSTTGILRQLPGFEDINVTFFPDRLMEQIATRPGVVTDKYYENDEGDVLDGIPVALPAE